MKSSTQQWLLGGGEGNEILGGIATNVLQNAN